MLISRSYDQSWNQLDLDDLLKGETIFNCAVAINALGKSFNQQSPVPLTQYYVPYSTNTDTKLTSLNIVRIEHTPSFRLLLYDVSTNDVGMLGQSIYQIHGLFCHRDPVAVIQHCHALKTHITSTTSKCIMGNIQDTSSPWAHCTNSTEV